MLLLPVVHFNYRSLYSRPSSIHEYFDSIGVLGILHSVERRERVLPEAVRHLS